MTYSVDLRERVLSYIKEGGSHAVAARLFKVTPRTIYNWHQRKNLEPKKHGFRRRKLDKELLAKHVRDYPDALLRERAAYFGVRVNAIWVAKHALGIVKKTA
jgi:putative transposase